MPPTLSFMLIYTFLPLAWGGMNWEQPLTDLKHLPFNFPSMGGHLWFMYPLISIYLIIPIVSPWLEKASAKEERIFLGLFALSTFIPWIHRFITDELIETPLLEWSWEFCTPPTCRWPPSACSWCSPASAAKPRQG